MTKAEQSDEHPNSLITVGWREWIKLPELELPSIKAKIDTGARTSCIHAFSIRPYMENGRQRIEFQIHPKQRNNEYVAVCNADVIDQRVVTDSGGHKEDRWVIETLLVLGSYSWPIEVTLSSRDDMRFRMLIGRTALTNRALVNSARSYLVGKKPKRKKETPS